MEPSRQNIYTPPGGPPQARPPQGIWKSLGNQGLYDLCADFYQRLGKSEIANMFPDELVAASRNQAEFLIGVLGGPPIYIEKRGHPRMRQRHFPFTIDEAARQEWLRCFRETLAEGDWPLSDEQQNALLAWLTTFSAWMVNEAPSS